MTHYIFAAFGQSNMLGVASTSGYPSGWVPSSVHSRLGFYIQNDSTRYPITSEPINSIINQVAPGGGHIVSMLVELAYARPNDSFSCVLGARSGWPMRSWLVGSSWYNACRDAVLNVASQGVVAGLLWWQGESDADAVTFAGDSALYQARTQTVIDQYRVDLGITTKPLMLCQLPATAPGGNYTDWEVIRSAQAALSFTGPYKMFVPRAVMQDTLHVGPASQRAVGTGMATWLLGSGLL